MPGDPANFCESCSGTPDMKKKKPVKLSTLGKQLLEYNVHKWLHDNLQDYKCGKLACVFPELCSIWQSVDASKDSPAVSALLERILLNEAAHRDAHAKLAKRASGDNDDDDSLNKVHDEKQELRAEIDACQSQVETLAAKLGEKEELLSAMLAGRDSQQHAVMAAVNEAMADERALASTSAMHGMVYEVMDAAGVFQTSLTLFESMDQDNRAHEAFVAATKTAVKEYLGRARKEALAKLRKKLDDVERASLG